MATVPSFGLYNLASGSKRPQFRHNVGSLEPSDSRRASAYDRLATGLPKPGVRPPTSDAVALALDALVDSALVENGISKAVHNHGSPYLDNFVDVIQSAIAAISKEACTRIAGLGKERNALVGQPKFPAELMARIIAGSVDSEPYPLQRLAKLSKVSTGWWAAIQENPALWCNIRSSCVGAETAIIRSKNFPIHVVLEDAHMTPETRRARNRTIVSQKLRWQSLLVSTHDRQTFHDLFDQLLPLLTSATLRFEGTNQLRLSTFSRGPRLLDLQLSGVLLPQWSSMEVENLQRLEVERIRVTPNWCKDLITAIAPNSKLETLRLRRIRFPGWEHGQMLPSLPEVDATTTSLKALILEEVDPPILCPLLQAIRCPQLLSLRIDSSDKHPSALLEALCPPDGTPSLIRCVLDNSQLSQIHIHALPEIVRIKNSESDLTSVANEEVLRVAVETSDLSQTLTQVAETVEARTLSVPIHLHLRVERGILQTADLIALFPSTTSIEVASTKDATIVLRFLKTGGQNVREVKLVCNCYREGVFLTLLREVQELVQRRPEIEVLDNRGNRYQWGLTNFMHRPIPSDFWTVYTPSSST